MSPLANELLRRHQANLGKMFYGDPANNGDFAEREGFAAVDAAYDELLEAELVVRQGLVSFRGTPRSTFVITQKGRTAQGVDPQ